MELRPASTGNRETAALTPPYLGSRFETPTEHVAVVAPGARLDALAAPSLRRQLAAHLETGRADFVLDLSQVREIDSSGMAALAQLVRAARQRGGSVVSRGASPHLQCLFELTGLDQVVPLA